MIETGIFGGTFNPPHLAHTALAACICSLECLDEVWLMVSPLNPLKANHPNLLPENTRLRLVQLAVADDSRLKASDFEFRLSRPSYTAHTLAALRSSYTHRRFSLIIGADNWADFPSWRDGDDILSHHSIFIYPRRGYSVNHAVLPEGVKLVDAPLYDLSSTELRRCIARGGDASYGLHPNVWREIRAKRYYLND